MVLGRLGDQVAKQLKLTADLQKKSWYFKFQYFYAVLHKIDSPSLAYLFICLFSTHPAKGSSLESNRPVENP